MKRFPWFEVILILVIASISLYGAFADGQNFSSRWFTRDDAYYYFKVAQNISEGHGSTFDGINKTNGYHPLWMLICIPIFALARFDLILPLRILFLLMGGLSIATAILLYKLIGRVFIPAIGALVALYWVFSLNVLNRVYKQGLETGILAFFLVLFVYKLYEFERSWRESGVTPKQLIGLGLLGALVILSRLDSIFLVGLVGFWLVFRKSPMRHLLLLDIPCICFSVLLAFVIKAGFPEYYEFEDVAVTMIGVSLLVKLPLAYFLGLYQYARIHNLSRLLGSLAFFVVLSSAIVGTLMLIIAPLRDFDSFPRLVLVYDAVSTIMLFGLIRLLPLGLKTTDSAPAVDETPIVHLLNHWRQWLMEGIVYYGGSFGPLGIYMLWSKFEFGTYIPVSGQIKRWWGSFPNRVYGGPAKNIRAFFGIDYTGDSNAWHPVSTQLGRWAEQLRQLQIVDTWRYVAILVLFALLFYCLLLLNKRKSKTALAQLSVIPLLGGSWLQIFYYHMLGYSAYKTWYWTSQLVLVTITVSFIVGTLYLFIRKRSVASKVVWIPALLLGLYMGYTFSSYVRHTMTYGEFSASDPYMDLATFLESHTEPGSIIGMTGGGNVGYFIKDRAIINMDGLINSYDYFQLLQRREAGKYLAERGMNYILASIDLLNGLPYRGQYNEYMEWMDVHYGGKDLVRYHPTIQP